MGEQVITKQENAIKLTRGQKGSYAWEIKIAGDNEDEILKRIKETDFKMKEDFPHIVLDEIEDSPQKPL